MMNTFRFITLTHATLNRPVEVRAEAVVGIMFSEKMNATHVYCMGQTIYPVKEAVEDIKNKLNDITKE